MLTSLQHDMYKKSYVDGWMSNYFIEGDLQLNTISTVNLYDLITRR